MHRHAKLVERIEVIEVRQARQTNGDDRQVGRLPIDLGGSHGRASALEAGGILLGQTDVRQVWHDADQRTSGALFEELKTWPEQTDVTPETIDDETSDQLALSWLEQLKGPDQAGEDPAPVDV